MPKTIPKEHFALIHRYLYHGSPAAATLDHTKHRVLMCLCNGYGQLTSIELIEQGLMWDWSHVRDSDTEALQKVYDKLKEWNL